MTYENFKQRADQEREERRVVACVNAFEGIPTERIEGKDLGQILAGELRLNGAGPRADGGFGFEFSGGVCQLMAEAYAEQFRQSNAINYLELLFNHTEIGPLTITMQRVEGLTPANKLALAESEHDALQEQVQKLAAEGAIMLRLLTNISENYCESQSESEDSIAAIDLDYISEVNTYISRDVEAENPFEASDAVIREIRNAVIDDAINAMVTSGAQLFRDCVVAVNQLRAGEKP